LFSIIYINLQESSTLSILRSGRCSHSRFGKYIPMSLRRVSFPIQRVLET